MTELTPEARADLTRLIIDELRDLVAHDEAHGVTRAQITTELDRRIRILRERKNP